MMLVLLIDYVPVRFLLALVVPLKTVRNLDASRILVGAQCIDDLHGLSSDVLQGFLLGARSFQEATACLLERLNVGDVRSLLRVTSYALSRSGRVGCRVVR